MKSYRKTYDEVMEDLYANFYQFLSGYDETRGAKFITHVGNQTRYLCLNLMKEKSKIVLMSDAQKTWVENLEKSGEQYNKFQEERKLKGEDVIGMIEKLSKPKYQYIIQNRYLVDTPLSFHEIAENLETSYQSVLTWNRIALKELKKMFSESERPAL